MKNIKIYFPFHIILFSVLFTSLVAQNPVLDSLKIVLPSLKEDTSKANTLNSISRELFLGGKYDSSMACAINSKSISEKANFAKGVSNAYSNIGNILLTKGDKEEALKNYNLSLKALEGIPQKNDIKKLFGNSYSNIGNVYTTQGNYEEGLKNYLIALKFRQEANDKKGIAISYANIGVVAYYQGNYPEALKNYLAALKLDKERGDKIAIARSYNNTGNIYMQQSEYDDALKNYSEALTIQKEIGDKQGIGRSYNNIGAVSFQLKKYTEALDAFLAGLKIKEELDDKYGIGHAHINIGDVLYTQSQISRISEVERKVKMEKALQEFFQALEVLSITGDKQGMAMCYNNIGTMYVFLNKGTEAITQLKKGLALSKEVGSKEDIKASYRGLASADSLMGNWKEAYNNHLQFVVYRDSLLNEENTKKLVQAQMNFDFEEKELKTKAEQDKKEIIYQKQQIIIYSVVFILFIAIIFSFFLYKRFQITSHQKRIIENQKDEVDIAYLKLHEKSKEITDSINYASRIQRALMPNERFIERCFKRLKGEG